MPPLLSPPIDQEQEVLPIAIDREWTVSLVDLCMGVAADFVPGRMEEEEYIARKNARVNVDDNISTSCIFMLELGDSSRIFHRMQYNAMLRYADKQQDNFHVFNLPSSPLCDPSYEETVCLPLQEYIDVGANINLHFASTPERSCPDGGRCVAVKVGCLDDVLIKEGSADDAVVEEEGSADAPDEPCPPAMIGPKKLYSLTKSTDWTMLKNGQPGRPVAPVPYTGGNELFSVKMYIDKVQEMRDANGDLRHSRIFDDLLPTIGLDHFYAYLAARVRLSHSWKPPYYKPDEDIIILTDHITCFYGCWLAQLNNGFSSIDDSWSTRDPLETIGPLKESMPPDAFRDMYRCMHFTDDFDKESLDEWSDVYFDEKHTLPTAARHHKK